MVVLIITKAIFLHSTDQEFTPVGVKSEIPYEKWFNYFKHFLMKNATSENVKNLFMWWNGRVFSFDTAHKVVESKGMESSGIDEAELGLNASGDSEIEDLRLTNHQEPENRGGEEVVDGFSNLTLGAAQLNLTPISLSLVRLVGHLFLIVTNIVILTCIYVQSLS